MIRQTISNKKIYEKLPAYGGTSDEGGLIAMEFNKD